MKLEDITNQNLMCILKSTTKNDVLVELLELINKSGLALNLNNAKEKIFHRESLVSTGIGLGIAIPHIYIQGLDHTVLAVGINPSGIPDYESIADELSVKIVIMIIVGEDQKEEYLNILSKVVAKFKDKDLRNNLVKAESSEEIYKLFIGETK